jgi:4-hydroxy-2-oxoglutarate aldolase
MNSEAFIAHYTAVADASPVPVLLYNFTALTGVELPVEAVGVLAQHPNIVGMKESASDVLRMADLTAFGADDFRLFAGSATTFHQTLAVGAAGGILATACVLPDVCVRLYELTVSGEQAEARALQQRLLTAVKLLSGHGVPGLKAAAAIAGYDAGFPRLPLLPVAEAVVMELREALGEFQQ